MPTYAFRNKTTGEVFEKRLKITEKENFLKNNPELESVLTVVPFSYDSESLSGKKPDEGFRDVLRNIRDNAIGGRAMKSKYI